MADADDREVRAEAVVNGRQGQTVVARVWSEQVTLHVGQLEIEIEHDVFRMFVMHVLIRTFRFRRPRPARR